jgi:hypothetical protein
MSKSAFEQWNMPHTENRELAEHYIHHADFDYGNTYTYSDLEYSIMNVNFDTRFNISDELAWTLDVSYYDLEDKTGWVYGDESGHYYVVKTGIQFGNLGW